MDNSEPQNDRFQFKIIAPSYTISNKDQGVIFESPTLYQLQQEKTLKVEKPFTKNVEKLVERYEEYGRKANPGCFEEYQLLRSFDEDEKTIPPSFRVCCFRYFKKGCKASFLYQFDQQQRCYYLKQAKNKHYHKIDREQHKQKKPPKPRKTSHTFLSHLTPPQKREYHLAKMREYGREYHARKRQEQRLEAKERIKLMRELTLEQKQRYNQQKQKAYSKSYYEKKKKRMARMKKIAKQQKFEKSKQRDLSNEIEYKLQNCGDI